MKRLILCGVLAFGLPGLVNAQTSNGSSSTSSSGTMQSSNKGQTSKKNKKSTPSNNRKDYNWKNGQRATPTGNEATGTNSSYSAIGRDTTRKGKQ